MIPVYPSAVWMPAHVTNFRLVERASFDLIIIHATDGRGDPKACAAMWQKARHGSSAHAVVGQDATVVQAVRFDDVAFHAHQQNARSVGIEHCCRTPRELSPTDPGLPPNADQLTASARLVAWLCLTNGLQPTRKTIKGHAEADGDTTHSDCPEGSGLLLDLYVVTVGAQYQMLKDLAFT